MASHGDADRGHQCDHVCQVSTSSVCQTLDEMEFERGVWSAAMNGEIQKVDTYLQNGGDANVLDTSGYTALHYAARSGHVDVCRLLLRHRANVNAKTRSGWVTPLHRAAYCCHINVVRLLLESGANVNTCDSDGKSPLHKAAERGNVAIAKLLLCKDQRISDIADNHQRKAKDYIPQGNTELFNLLSAT